MAFETYRGRRDSKATSEPRGKKVADHKGDGCFIQPQRRGACATTFGSRWTVC